ncbi:type II secretion system F family protein [Kitasatospora sp. NPDC058170]|uniref:type II secretion system F family protein n=1 Tax=Kitasatospora sp. NPDC058170 TaxID=3346364 RepID=UPI0036D8DB06
MAGDMARDQLALCWALVLCGVAGAGWCSLQRQVSGVRRSRLLLAGEGGDPGVKWGRAPARPGRGTGRRVTWRVPELLLLPAGLVAGVVTASPVPVLAAALAALPLRGWRLRREAARSARLRGTAVVDLCAALAGELRSGATPEQALHLVTARIAADREVLRRLGEEPVARLAAGRYGGDVPAAFQLLAELPGGSGAVALAACWQVASDSGSGLAAGLDRVAEALRGEHALAEEIEGELAGPRTTISVLAVLPAAGLVLGVALGARPVDVLLHTTAGLGCLAAGVALEAVGLVWMARIVRAASVGALGGTAGGGRPVGGGSDRVDAGGWRCGISRTRGRGGVPSGAFREEAMSR